MGTIKFYNGGQSVTECMLFSLMDIYTLKSSYSLSVYPAHVYSERDLTTVVSNAYVPILYYQSNTSTYMYNFCVKRFGIPQSNNTLWGSTFGSSDTISDHDATLSTFNNTVASVGYLNEATYNGVKTMVLSVTNLSNENSTTVCSLQRSNYFYFSSTPYSSSQNGYYYLDWAYYFDEDEYITLEPGETKSVVLNFSLSDLTA